MTRSATEYILPSSPAIDVTQKPLDQQVILITGATGSLGRECALACARAGATVILHGKRQALLDALYDEIVTAGLPQPAQLRLDLVEAREAHFKELAETVHASFKRLDVIVHAANHCKQLMPMTLQDSTMWEPYLRVNTIAPIGITRACWPMFRRATNARIVFVSETHATTPKAYWGAYATSKSALEHAVATWQDELAPQDNVFLGVYVPGPFAGNSRAVTHPGELASSLPSAADVANDVMRLLLRDESAPHALLYRRAQSPMPD